MADNQTKPSGSEGLNVSRIFVILAIAAIAVAVVFWLISLGRNYQASSIEKKLSDVSSETKGMGQTQIKAETIYSAEQNLNSINSSKSYWSKILSDLAADTTKDVSLSEFSTDESGVITLNGATSNYAALGKFLSSLRNSNTFSDVMLQGATLTAEAAADPLTFSIKLTASAAK